MAGLMKATIIALGLSLGGLSFSAARVVSGAEPPSVDEPKVSTAEQRAKAAEIQTLAAELAKPTEAWDHRKPNKYNIARLMVAQGKEAVPELTRLLANDVAAPYAAFALGELAKDATSSLDALTKSLDHPFWSVRKEAVIALGKMGPEAKSAIPKLIERLDETLPVVGDEVPRALGKIGPDAIPPLLESLKTRDGGRRLPVLDAFGFMGEKGAEAIPAMVELVRAEQRGPFSRRDTYSIERVEWALKRMGPKGEAALAALAAERERGHGQLAAVALPEGATLRLTNPRSEHGSAVLALAFSPDGATIATGGADRAVHLWNAKTGERIGSFEVDHAQYAVTSLAFSPNGKQLAVAHNHEIRIWDIEKRAVSKAIIGHQCPVSPIAFSPDGTRVIGCDALAQGPGFEVEGGTARLWNLEGAAVAKFVSPSGRFSGAAFTHKGDRLVLSDTYNGVVVVRPSDGKTLAAFPSKERMSGAALLPEGDKLFTAGEKGAVRVLDVATGKDLFRIPAHTGEITTLSVSADGKSLVTAGTDRVVKVIDLATLKERASFRGHTDEVTSVSIAPDGKSVASSSRDSTALVWSLDSVSR